MKKPFVDEPDGVSETGAKLWLDQYMTNYATKPSYGFGGKVVGEGLADHQVMYVELPDGERTIIVAHEGRAIYEHTSVEHIGIWIDTQKLLKSGK